MQDMDADWQRKRYGLPVVVAENMPAWEAKTDFAM
jgi:hypothetical protein